MDSRLIHPGQTQMQRVILLVVFIFEMLICACSSHKSVCSSTVERDEETAIIQEVDSSYTRVLTEELRNSELELTDVNVVIQDTMGRTKTIHVAKVTKKDINHVNSDSINRGIVKVNKDVVKSTTTNIKATTQSDTNNWGYRLWWLLCVLTVVLLLKNSLTRR